MNVKENIEKRIMHLLSDVLDENYPRRHNDCSKSIVITDYIEHKLIVLH